MDTIICIGCSTNLSARIPLVKALWHLIESRTRDQSRTVAAENLSQIDRTLLMGPLLDAVHLPRVCCRMEILGRARASELAVIEAKR